MDDRPDDLARLMHEALETLGWGAGPENIAEQVRRLDAGLPAEDEFSVICAWLGKCELIHKLDQHQMPLNSKGKYQVPDLLARFTTQSNERPVLIEVKSKAGKTLSFKPDYLKRLQDYADLMGMPLLIAWKYHALWVLFEPKHLKKSIKNFNISIGDAMCESLMGILLGDIAYKIGEGAGVHLQCDKEALVAEETVENAIQQSWNTTITEVRFTDRNSELIEAPSLETQTLFKIWDLEELLEYHDDHIRISYTAPGDGMRFAHMSLVDLLRLWAPDQEKMSWRRVARKDRFTSIEDFRGAVEKAMNEKVVHFILNMLPRSIPKFVNEPDAHGNLTLGP
ncbi:MAG: restriction endonuclease [Hyphomonas sp.]